MARVAAKRPHAGNDKLRNLLDDLAEKAVMMILADGDATPRAMSDVLKVAGGYWAVSRKGEDPDKAPSAWERYGKAMAVSEKEEHGAPN